MKPSAILLANPFFKVTVDHTGEMIALKGLCWDFNKVGADTFKYNAMTSMAAITALNNVILSRGLIGVEAYHLSLAKVDPESGRFKQTDENYVGAIIPRKLDIEYLAGLPSQIWAHLDIRGGASNVIEQLLQNYPGTRLAMRFESESMLNESRDMPGTFEGTHLRFISKIYGIDMVVEKVEEVVKKTTTRNAKSLVKFAHDEIQTMVDALSIEVPDVLYSTDNYIYRGHIPRESHEVRPSDFEGDVASMIQFSMVDVPDVSSLAPDKAQLAIASWTGSTILNQIYSNIMPDRSRTVTLESAVRMTFKDISDHLQKVTTIAAVPNPGTKSTLYIVASYSEAVGLFNELSGYAEGTPQYEFCERVSVVIVPLSQALEGSAIAFLTTPTLPYGLYVHQVQPDGIWSAYASHSKQGWLFTIE